MIYIPGAPIAPPDDNAEVENHFPVANDNHDIADRRIRITPEGHQRFPVHSNPSAR
jgi:hypothetical protein